MISQHQCVRHDFPSLLLVLELRDGCFIPTHGRVSVFGVWGRVSSVIYY